MNELIKTDDLGQLKEIMDDEFEMLIELFVDDSSKLLEEIKVANLDHQAEALCIAAHTLKGSSANMCAPSITDICKAIEYKAKESDFSGVDELIEQLSDIHTQVAEILKKF